MLLLLLSIISHASDNEITNKIEFTIIDRYITDNSFINLLIKNKTSTDYYLPIINTVKTEKWDLLLSFEEHSFFFLTTIFFDKSKNEIPWHTVNCNNLTNNEDLEYLWEQKKKSIKVKDLILLKSGESVTIKLPLYLFVKISEECTWELKDNKIRKGLNVSIFYPKKRTELESKYLTRNTIEELKLKGYKLYTDEIISNNVNLNTKHTDNIIDTIQKDKFRIDSLKYLERLRKHVDIPKGSIQEKYFRYYMHNLSHPNRLEKYPLFPTEKLCSIEKCFRSLSLPEINVIIYRRLIEIAKINFKNKIYLFLVAGGGSVEFAEKQNVKITDDNQQIYISVDDFINSKEILKGVEIYNSETKKLMAGLKKL